MRESDLNQDDQEKYIKNEFTNVIEDHKNILLID